mgnify:CR=1 FL=1
MESASLKARELLGSGKYTCVLCSDDVTLTATHRGVRPLLDWLDSGMELKGFSAADKVVGRATAFLYCLLGVKDVYAGVISQPAAQVLKNHEIAFDAGLVVDGIINRQGTGPCPFETAVLHIDTAPEALEAIRRKMASFQ